MKTGRACVTVALGAFLSCSATAQVTSVPTPVPTATPTPAAQAASPTAAATAAVTPSASETRATAEPLPSPSPRPRTEEAPPLRITEAPAVSVAVLPPENPFGSDVDAPAALPPKPLVEDAILTSALFVEVRVDSNGKPLIVRRVRDPIPSMGPETQKDLARWTFEPARRAGQKVETWAPLRLDLQVEIEAPEIQQSALTPITPATPLPAPFDWGSDESWYQALKLPDPTDGTVPVSQLDAAAVPKRTPFPDSYRGPFSARLWVHVNPSGRVDKVIPIAASDPILIPYFRKAVAKWTLRPARKGTTPVESWNELTLSGQADYKVEIRQIAQLRKPLAS
jgi:hypothetical protein